MTVTSDETAVGPDVGAQTRRPAVRRATALALLALGLALAAAPLAFQMFSRAPQGAIMIDEFRPFMTEQRLDGFQADIAAIDAAVHEVDARGGAAAARSEGYQELSRGWPTIHADMTDLLDTVQGNIGNYEAVAALPSFRLFPWFFVVPGLLVAAVGAGLLAGRLPVRTGIVGLLILGIGLAAAPAAFQMFTRAPQGGDMMNAFEELETTEKVTAIQGYFATMAVGQGAMRLDVVPALERSAPGTSLPAADRLDERWVAILNDMTPMIGAMSDNVDNYQAISSLPPFPLFPYFFLLPGLLVVGLALTVRAPSRGDL